MGGDAVTREVRVLIYHSATDEAAILSAYHTVSEKMSQVPGMLGNELLHSMSEPNSYVVLSRWMDFESFRTWEQGAQHRNNTAALRPYRDEQMTMPFAVFEVGASY
ncbi:antibiotic biosynthesis monooxygenase family protein [Nocardia salmonicida]|uniref:antibiotic biosynthesis monooxygenase family protein n=1 Tax=Nocardia salmonicida TaxID=53431 RepID=UPI003CF7DCD0